MKTKEEFPQSIFLSMKQPKILYTKYIIRLNRFFPIILVI